MYLLQKAQWPGQVSKLFLMGSHHPQKVLTFKPTLFGNKEVFHKSPSSGKAKMCPCGRSYVENHLSLSSSRISMGMRCRRGLTQYLVRQHSLLKQRAKGTAVQPPRKPVLRPEQTCVRDCPSSESLSIPSRTQCEDWLVRPCNLTFFQCLL